MTVKELLTKQGFAQVIEYAHKEPTAMAVASLMNELRAIERSGLLLTYYTVYMESRTQIVYFLNNSCTQN